MELHELLTEILRSFVDVGHSLLLHTPIVLAAGFVAGWITNRMARKEWLQGMFKHRVHLSLNRFIDGNLVIRTLGEHKDKDIILSPYALKLVEKARKNAEKSGHSILRFANQRDAWLVLNELRKEFSKIFAKEFIEADFADNDAEEALLIAMAWEPGDKHIQKLEIICVRKKTLDENERQLRAGKTPEAIVRNLVEAERSKTLEELNELLLSTFTYYNVLAVKKPVTV